MIVFTLKCPDGHEFETWFRDNAAYDRQARRGLVACPECGATDIEKAPMAPRLGRSSKSGSGPREVSGDTSSEAPAEAVPATPSLAPSPDRPPTQAEFRRALQVLRHHVESNCENVGKRFVEEARRIHKGEAKARGIYGDASPAEAKKLADDGIEIAAIPWVPTSDA
ncbi:MAG TPA: DUF1178 family protein [Stellaceae bacterium]|nr:DUF1178 family protein [Stellaceae bacterium]